MELDFLLYSLDWLLQTVEEVHLRGGGCELLKHAKDMSNDLMLELVTCRGHSVRDALAQLELPDGGLVNELLTKCEKKISLLPPQIGLGQEASGAAERNNACLAELVNNFAEAENESDKQVALIALADFRRANNDGDFEAQLSHLSPQFKEFILDQVGKASKESASENVHHVENSFNERIKNLRLKVGQDQAVEKMAVADKAASLRLRLEALRYSKGLQ